MCIEQGITLMPYSKWVVNVFLKGQVINILNFVPTYHLKVLNSSSNEM